MPQIKIPAVYYRGGTSKGVFFKRSDLPEAAREAGSARDKILLRVLGSPDPYGKQIDGLGNASSSTSKAVILDKSERADHDVDYLFGQVSIDKPFVDWSGNCGNLTAAVGAFAIEQGLVDKSKIPSDGLCTVKIWQKNIGKTIIAHVPMQNGAVLETGDFELDGVTFPAAEVQIEFLDPADGERPLLWPRLIEESNFSFPSGHSTFSAAIAVMLILLCRRTRYRRAAWIVVIVHTQWKKLIIHWQITLKKVSLQRILSSIYCVKYFILWLSSTKEMFFIEI